MKKYLLLIILAIAVPFLLDVAYSEESKVTSLAVLIEEALANNPRIQATYKDWRAAKYKVVQAAAFPDPMAKYAYLGEPVETKIGPQEQKFGLSQKIPFPVKLGLKATASVKHAEMIREKYEAAQREVIKNIKLIYYDIFWVDKAIQITEEEKTILENLEKVAQRKYESNLTPQQDVIKAQVEITKLINDLLLLRQHRKSLEARMNSVLNRPEDTVLGNVTEVQPESFEFELDQLREIAKDSRQELLAANLGIEKARYERSLAEFNFVPDITLGFDYIQVGDGYTRLRNDGNDAWMGTIAINVPIWFDKLGAELREKKATLASRMRDYEDVRNNVNYNIEDLYSKITTYRETVLLYKTALVPQAEQSFEAARTGYETGKVDFLNWLESERMLLRTRLAHYRAVADYLKYIAMLERTVGRDL